jgi:hypothetical protein
MTVQHNPLKQYFRRPAIYVKLPSEGKYYSPGVVNQTETGELPVYPMTAIDDITSKTPDALFNGSAVVELIKSCIPDIRDPWSINSSDLDAILIAIRSASAGAELDIETECPSCNEEAKYGINLMGVLTTLKAGDYDTELKVNDLSIKFRPLTYKEMNQISISQFELQKLFSGIEATENVIERNIKTKDALTSITNVAMQVLSTTIEHIRTPISEVTENEYIYDFLQNCDKNMYEQIKTYHENIKKDTELKPLKVTCIHCNHAYEKAFTLNISDFFG